jgi:ABC-type protease/lipase transport system fused ATPase/permease subunit
MKKRHITVVVITHRPAILGVVDKIAFLRDGELGVFGSRDDVMAALSPKASATQGEAR